MSWREQTGCFWKRKEDGPACPQVSPDSRRGLCRATSWHETTLLSTALHWISHQTISTASAVFPSPSNRLGEVQSVNKGYRFRSPLVCKSWNWAIPIKCTKDCTFKTKHPQMVFGVDNLLEAQVLKKIPIFSRWRVGSGTYKKIYRDLFQDATRQGWEEADNSPSSYSYVCRRGSSLKETGRHP